MLRVGIEVHARILSATKLFSRASAVLLPNAKPNAQVDALDYGLPGAMPLLNAHCVTQAIRAGLVLNGHVQPVSRFERKHYMYCDQPLGYQITQNSAPIVVGGFLRLASTERVVRLARIQLEQDTAKSMHLDDASLVDFNRAGVGLLEIVSEPDMTTPAEASEYVKTLQALLRHVGVCDGRMEDGSLRADVNVSVGERGRRVEVKNLNSLRSIERAVAFENARLQAEPHGANETRGFDALTGETLALRDKDSALDYRFMPEPDLPPLYVTSAEVARVRAALSELPDETKSRLAAMGVDAYAAQLLARPELLALLDAVLASKPGLDAKMVANWVCNALVSAAGEHVDAVHASDVADLVWRVQTHAMSTHEAKALMASHVAKGLSLPDAAATLTAATHDAVLAACVQAAAAHPNELARYKQGKKALLNFFVGKAVAALPKSVDANAVRTAMQHVLHSKKE